MTDSTGPRSPGFRERFLGTDPDPSPEPLVVDPATVDLNDLPIPTLRLVESERPASFFMTGGLVAAHSEARERDAIWDALQRREVYGTSGDRILLWFDLVNGPDGTLPMGSQTELGWNPRFRVRAVGAFEQLPGCPEHSVSALSPERLEHLCRGECHHPGDTRRRITRIEVVRIRPQNRPDEPPDAAGCTVEFEDGDFASADRSAVYYVRAVQEPTLASNAANLRCTFDESGRCVEVDPCYGDARTALDDDCLSPNEERAWSSPIFVDVAR